MEKRIIYDILIIGAGPSGLFCALNLPNNKQIAILEKTETPAQKLLLSAKWRGNISNYQTNKQQYVPTSSLIEKTFTTYGVSDFLSFLKEHNFTFHEEEYGRILLDKKVKPFHQRLCTEVEQQQKIFYNTEVFSVKKDKEFFFIQTSQGEYISRNLIVATGSTSFPQLGSTDIAQTIANNFSLEFSPFFPALVGFETDKNMSNLSGSSVQGKCTLWNENQYIYEQEGVILFTHRWVSGPVIFNTSLYVSQPQNKKFTITIEIKKKDITKRLLTRLGFKKNILSNYKITTNIIKTRWKEEAKVCGWGIHPQELKTNFETHRIKGLYYLGEAINITGKTGGFNLQRCRSSAICCAKSFK